MPGPPTPANTHRPFRGVHVDTSRAYIGALKGVCSLAAPGLEPSNTHLALVKPRYQNIRANALFARLDRPGRAPQLDAEPFLRSLPIWRYAK